VTTLICAAEPEGAMMMFTEHEITNDLENRRRKNRRRWKVAEQCRRVVLELDVDWADFRGRFSAIDAATLCKGPGSPYRFRLVWSLLDDFELDECGIHRVLDYFSVPTATASSIAGST
jgi:hypothetical protein